MAPRDKSHAQRLVEERTGRPLVEQLRELYVERRLTDGEIGRLWEVERSTVNAWRREFGISRADRTVPVIEKVAS